MNKPTIDLRKIVHDKAKNKTKLSYQWMMKHIREAAAGMSAQRFLGDNIAYQSKNLQPGQMISFFYDPKTKDQLKFYDTFPMLLPFAADNTHFWGLNLHYLDPIRRAKLLSKLMDYINDDNLSPKAKLQFTWATIKGASQLSDAKHCVKQYLFKQVKSNYIIIPPKEWEMVVFLPVERFKKATNQEVWSHSK